MSIAGMLAGIADNLSAIPDLRTFDYEPASINPPVAFVSMTGIDFEDTMDTENLGTFTLHVGVMVVVGAADERTAQSKLFEYIEQEEPRSVYQAFLADPTLGGNAADCRVDGSKLNISRVTFGATDYLAVTFEAEVLSP